MKTKFFLLITVLFFTANSLTAQISIQADSIQTVLCQKWKFKAILMGGERLTNMNETVTYEFNTDGTFKRVSSKGKAENGKWVYRPEQKIIVLNIKKNTLHIPSLSGTELVVSPGGGTGETDNILGTGIILQPADNN